MKREDAIASLRADREWDILVIGGGATGLGIALDAATRGYATVLVEAGDFAHGTSSRSTKLIHGGVRYLRQGNISLVRSSLSERERLRRNAPDFVSNLQFLVPAYAPFDRLYYGIGLKLYEWLAGGGPEHATDILPRDAVLAEMPTLRKEGLRGGILYHDSQFDDARFALALAREAIAAGSAVANYVRAESLIRVEGRVRGAIVRDSETGETSNVRARVVINAGGVFSDEVRRLEEPKVGSIIRPSQGAHLVLPARFLPGGRAVMIPKTSDGRLLFAIPWLGRVVVGTTDTPVSQIEAEPAALREEIDFLLEHAALYLDPPPKVSDVLSVFAGLRPLAVASAQGGGATSRLSRDHLILVSPGGMVSIAGGKWTTYRKMAEDAVDRAAATGGLNPRPCRTADHGIRESHPAGSDTQPLHPKLTVSAAAVRHAAREEMARSVDDVLSRRTRSVFLDARASIEVAPAVADILAAEHGWGEARKSASLNAFLDLAARYLPEAG